MDPRSQVRSVGLAGAALRGDVGPSLGGEGAHQRLDGHVTMGGDGTLGELAHTEGAFTCDGVAADTCRRVHRDRSKPQISRRQVTSGELLYDGR